MVGEIDHKTRIDSGWKRCKQSQVAWVYKNFEEWRWEQIIVWGMAVLRGHQQVFNQLATSHETLANKYLSFPQVLQFVKGDFQTKTLPRATCELH